MSAKQHSPQQSPVSAEPASSSAQTRPPGTEGPGFFGDLFSDAQDLFGNSRLAALMGKAWHGAVAGDGGASGAPPSAAPASSAGAGGKTPAAPQAATPAPAPAQDPRLRYEVQPGDSLARIAQAFTGNPGDLTDLLAANCHLVADPDLLFPGQILTLPMDWLAPLPMTKDAGCCFGPMSAQSAANMESQATPPTFPASLAVEVLHDSTNPVATQGDERPATPLYRKAPGGAPVNEVIGSLDIPVVQNNALPDTLFIGGRPSADDVQQGDVGDCYLLAALTSIAANDPAAIMRCIQPVPGGVTVTFQAFDSGSQSWEPVPTTVSWSVVSGGFWPLYAQYRSAPEPSRCDWSANIVGESLFLTQVAWYEMATWVAMIEKAYADFAEGHGQYGTGTASGVGYDGIEGGWPEMVLPLFYGATAAVFRENSKMEADTGEIVKENQPIIERLAALHAQGPSSSSLLHLTAVTAHGEHALRALPIIDEVRTLRANPLHRLRWSGLLDGDAGRKFENILRTFVTVTKTSPVSPDPEVRLQHVAALATALLDGDQFPIMYEGPAPYRHLTEVLASFAKSPTGAFNLVRRHAYAVRDASLCDHRGRPLAGPISDILPLIDPEVSLVTLQNPHHTNEPNILAPVPEGEDDGVFQLDLGAFLRCFVTVRGGVAPRTGGP